MRHRTRQSRTTKRKRISIQKLMDQASPSARQLIIDLTEEGVQVEPYKIPRTGKAGNIIKKDVQAYVKSLEDSASEEE